MTPRERIDELLSVAVGRDLTSWERHKLLPSLRERTELTPRQDALLTDIERRVYGDDDAEEE